MLVLLLGYLLQCFCNVNVYLIDNKFIQWFEFVRKNNKWEHFNNRSFYFIVSSMSSLFFLLNLISNEERRKKGLHLDTIFESEIGLD